MTDGTRAGWSDAQKWFAGIAATIIGGVLTAVLVQATKSDDAPNNGNTPSPTVTIPSAADVRIVAFNPPQLADRTNPYANFSVSNYGDTDASRCGFRGNVGPLGDEFTVPAHSSVRVTWNIATHNLPSGGGTVTVYVNCENARSPAVSKNVIVL